MSSFICCVPGKSGFTVVDADSKEAAADQFAAAVGHSSPADTEGNSTTVVGVVELDVVKVDAGAVEKILNPSAKE